MKFQFLAFLTLISLVSCSSNKSVSDDMDSQVQDSVGLEDENSYEDNESIYEEKYSEDTIEPESDTSVMAESSSPTAPTPSLSGDEGVYTVEKGDTLMLISFKLYGDYSKWKTIQNLNPTIESYDRLQTGTQLTIVKPSEAFSWQPSGNPYLIRRNDTLRKISTNLYETPRNWKHLYEHNKPLIKDPNIIFAGFTIYYLSAQELNRDPATAQYPQETPVQEQENISPEPYAANDTVEEMAPEPEPTETFAQVEEPIAAEESLESEMLQEEGEPEAEEFNE